MKGASILLPTLISDLIKFKVFIKLHLSQCNYSLQIKTFRKNNPHLSYTHGIFHLKGSHVK